MPMSPDFERRLLPILNSIVARFGTPFHIYDEAGIRQTCTRVNHAFADLPFRQYFAVKALPNPWILKLISEAGHGFDCASAVEVELVRRLGISGERIFFTSNNTLPEDFAAARTAGAILNIDDVAFIDKLEPFPDLACFRVSPSGIQRECQHIGSSRETKFGVPEPHLAEAFRRARVRGATRFGLHAMLCSNELRVESAVEAATQVLERAAALASTLDLRFEFVNIGGGLGIAYRPKEEPFDLETFAVLLSAVRRRIFGPVWAPAVYMECGRFITGPHGVLVTRVANKLMKWKTFLGVDASMSALMRPALYGAAAYHHVTAPFATTRQRIVADVVGALCENNDKFAIDRELPNVTEGEILLIHDTGAHGHAMGFTYNGRLRPRELLLCPDGEVVEIRRPESVEDYLAAVPTSPVPIEAVAKNEAVG